MSSGSKTGFPQMLILVVPYASLQLPFTMLTQWVIVKAHYVHMSAKGIVPSNDSRDSAQQVPR